MILAAVLLLAGCQAKPPADGTEPSSWKPIPSVRPGGVLGERLQLWRESRLWRVSDDPFLLDGFEGRPGKHAWQGEHVGKWLHAATLAHEANGDPKLLERLQQTVNRLVATQEEDGYLGTYVPELRFYSPPGPHTKGSWDIWTHRYVLYGLLTWERFHPDPAVVEACTRIGDLLIEAFGPNGQDLTSTGTKNGISSATVLESVMMLYDRTREPRFLEFAEHLHSLIEANEQLRLVSHFQEGGDAETPGEGKAYQLMAVLLGYGELQRFTGEESYLQAAVKGWENIRSDHTYETGGPWSYKSNATKNKECFAPPEFFDPTNVVETCSTVTWVQLSLELLRLTGEARYAREAERAVLNHLLGAQSPNGTDWAYFTPPNSPRREHNDVIHCCGSSGPRALEMYARHLVGHNGQALTLNTYLPLSARLDGPFPALAGITIEGDYPFRNKATLQLELTAEAGFPLDFLVPEGTRSISVTIDGESQELTPLPSGYLRVERIWRPGEVVELEFDFALRAHYRDGRDGTRWVSFTRGPLALAQELPAAVLENAPPLSLEDDSTDSGEWLEPVADSDAGRGVAYSIRGTRVQLIPYYLAGSTTEAVRTFFPLKQ